MRCPRCGHLASEPATTCSRCGFDLSVFRSLHEIKSGLFHVRTDWEGLVRRLHALEAQVAGLEPVLIQKLPAETPPRPPETAAAATPIDRTPPTSVSAAKQVTTYTIPGPPRPRFETRGEAPSLVTDVNEIRFGQKWLLIAGIVLTVLAVGYFLKYAFDRNWIGPLGRVLMAYAGGLGLLGLGEFFRRKRFDVFGLYLMGGGIATLYFSTYAAFHIYGLIEQPTAFALMVAVTVSAALLAIRHDVQWLAVLGIIGGFLTPIVLSTGIDRQVALMTYMAILNGGILTIAAYKRWRLLNFLALWLTWLLFATWYYRHYEVFKFWPTTVFLNLFFLIHAVVPFVYYFLREGQRRVEGFSLSIPNAFIAFAFSFRTIRNAHSLEHVSIATTAYAVVFLSMAAHLYHRYRECVPAFVLLSAKGVFFLAITVPILFSEHWVTVFWALQGVTLLWAALRLGELRLRYGAVALLALAATKLLFHDYSEVFGLRLPMLYLGNGFDAAVWERWTTAGLVLVSLFRAGQMLAALPPQREKEVDPLAAVLRGSFGLWLFAILNIETAAYFHEYVPRACFAAISVLWAVFATGLIVLGFVQKSGALRYCSLGLFGATVLKVFLHDMANVETPYRILSFLVLGILLVGASYLYHRFKGRIAATQTSKSVEVGDL